ncbi:helix-turn-helix transcriptional regulator [Solitalea canadensis]|uniref:DNA-binding domain-containing protein, AraC-type n=1 Tax=Solitalea canadensis (strain ATCC 29591 / DSM 3403 / JCM 21819 / LMG 8368 / NBRC 15130 / NCIMB 12057 / USAM 9D) TaxID=929556 RepID=H8KP91_SOLCM|nr:helix-turn-helix transcriptional regulator [Solitalea canadensis]AFD05728.1 DNA-binding domain-containing protein, AraC-type [Solitalea canadensis DSM 3403]
MSNVRYYTVDPPAALADYVRSFWAFEMDLPEEQPYVYRSMADACTEMVFHYKGRFDNADGPQLKPEPLSMMHAQTQRYRRFITKGSFGIFGVYLYPFAVPRLLSVSSAELTDQMPDLHTLLGAEGAELEERMLHALDNRQRMVILSNYLLKRLQQQKEAPAVIRTAIKTAIQANGLINIPSFTEQFYLSSRQFERRFKEQSGFTLKTYCRILRFHSALNEYGNKAISLTDLAYQCGYYDQSHFINDFKQFSGYTPKEYFRGNAEGAEYREVE